MIIPISESLTVDPNEVYFIDANVLLFIHLNDKKRNQKTNKKIVYSRFVEYLQENGNSIFVSTLNLQEVLHVVEKIEFDQYHQINPKTKFKQYRQNKYERHKLKQKLDEILNQITQSYSIEDDSITKEDVESFVSDFERHLYDPMDFFTVHLRCQPNSKFNYITDDSDFKNNNLFQTSSLINLYTCTAV
ncbi:hypothetical protein MsAg5_13730 [Methanosarcinaceae archaeon Ag5]|uniref:PIN domain-containing protein n=1 Tax=Methanolapillus africanus TaxID=3028297 RepID=A0AAE4SE68_9EURY|nr:hypothetical protein [Methanosarcinaceae archaeon Ag5]